MASVEIICLANSIKDGGRCVAGLRMDSRGWVRPVGPGNGTLSRSDRELDSGGEPEVLDVIAVGLDQHVPQAYQAENWSLTRSKWQLVSRPAPVATASILRPHLERGPDLLLGQTDRVALSQLDPKLPQRSLTLVIPERVRWFRTTSVKGYAQARAEFELGDASYSLVVTDPLWKARVVQLPAGSHDGPALGLEAEQPVMLTVSLAGPLQDTCYKLVAAVIPLPPAWRGPLGR